MAERGNENSRVYKHNGLLYRMLDADGNPIGVPIKASLFYNKPILKSLQEKFRENEAKRMPYKSRVKNAIDMFLSGKKVTLQDLIKALEKQGIHVALRQNDKGFIYGVTMWIIRPNAYSTGAYWANSTVQKPFRNVASKKQFLSRSCLRIQPRNQLGYSLRLTPLRQKPRRIQTLCRLLHLSKKLETCWIP